MREFFLGRPEGSKQMRTVEEECRRLDQNEVVERSSVSQSPASTRRTALVFRDRVRDLRLCIQARRHGLQEGIDIRARL